MSGGERSCCLALNTDIKVFTHRTTSDEWILRVRGSVRNHVARAKLFKNSSVNLVAALPVGETQSKISEKLRVGVATEQCWQATDHRQSSMSSTTPPHYPTSIRLVQPASGRTHIPTNPWWKAANHRDYLPATTNYYLVWTIFFLNG